MRAATVEPVNVSLNPKSEACILDNWNPFPDSLEADAIEREFEHSWLQELRSIPQDGRPAPQESGGTCHWLYKSITMDSGGRVFPCCAPPRPDIELNFARFDGGEGEEPFNSEKYRLARLAFADPAAYGRARDKRPLEREPHCANCEWTKDRTNTDAAQIRQYFKAAGCEAFNPDSVEMLVS